MIPQPVGRAGGVWGASPRAPELAVGGWRDAPAARRLANEARRSFEQTLNSLKFLHRHCCNQTMPRGHSALLFAAWAKVGRAQSIFLPIIAALERDETDPAGFSNLVVNQAFSMQNDIPSVGSH